MLVMLLCPIMPGLLLPMPGPMLELLPRLTSPAKCSRSTCRGQCCATSAAALLPSTW